VRAGVAAAAELAQLAPGVRSPYDIREAIRDADVIMMLRVQLERQHEAPIPAGEYFRSTACAWSIWRWPNPTPS
jgi:aspartate carbamoyltransferase catalytic subunit